MNDKDITAAFLEIEKLKIRVERIKSHIDSESGTLGRETDRLRKEIEIVENSFRTIIYDTESGLLIKIDRLTQESIERRKTRNHIYALWVTIAGTIIAIIYDIFKRKN